MYCGFTAGLCGGILSMCVGYPLDTIKVHQQTQEAGGMITSAKNIMSAHGPLGLFRGMFVPLISSGVLNGMFFGSYEYVARKMEGHLYKERLEEQVRKVGDAAKIATYRLDYSAPSILAGGLAAGASQILIGCPVELLKIKIQLGIYVRPTTVVQKVSSYTVAHSLVKQHGVRGLYQGWSMMTLRELPSSVIYMCTYQEMSQILRRYVQSLPDHRQNLKRDTFFVAFLSGGLAGAFGSASSVPFDVLKSRIQASSFHDTAHLKISEHFAILYKEQGLSGFSRGLLPLVLRSFPVNGAAFVAYEMFVKICNTYFKF